MTEKTFAVALNEAIKEEMRLDPSVFVMGESIRGGIYGVTGGLHQEFGDDRVLDTPLSETAFVISSDYYSRWTDPTRPAHPVRRHPKPRAAGRNHVTYLIESRV